MEPIVTLLNEVINEKMSYEFAREHKFIQRSTSKLQGHEFIKTLILPSDGLAEDSLKGLCKRMQQINPDADISSQALAKRINSRSSVALMRAVFEKIICFVRSNIVYDDLQLKDTLKYFPSVLIEDSTVMKLHEKLAGKYKGTSRGGTGAKAQVKINLIQNIMSGQIFDLSIHSGNVPDQRLAAKALEYLKPNDLIIRDLGYFCLDNFQTISDIGSYYLSRLPSHIKVFLQKESIEPVDLGFYINKHYSNFNSVELDVFLGNKKVKTRLILYRVPEDVYNKRLREAYKYSKGRGRTLSKSKINLMKFTIFITNASNELLPIKLIGTVYRLRWDIELIFKLWKSELKLHILDGINPNRIDCLVWSRLCTVLLFSMMCSQLNHILYRLFKAELSPVKLINYLKRGNIFFYAVVNCKLEQFIQEIIKYAPRAIFKDKRKLRTTRERVFFNENYYGCAV